MCAKYRVFKGDIRENHGYSVPDWSEMWHSGPDPGATKDPDPSVIEG